MNYKKLINCIKKGEIENIYLFYGEETYLINDTLGRLKAKLIEPGLEQFNLVTIEGKEASYGKIVDACETLPFMAEKKLVYVDGLDIFHGKSECFSKKQEKKFIEYIAKIPESTTIVFYGNSSVDGRKRIVKEIKKHGVAVEFAKLKEHEFNRWIKSMFKACGKSIGAGELILFKNNLDYLGRSPSQNLFNVKNEIKKLVSFMGMETNLKEEHINKAMGSGFHNDIFNLLDSIEKRNFSESIKRLEHMLEKKEPVLRILATLGNQTKNILSSKLLLEEGCSNRDIASKLKIHPYVATKCASQSKQFTVKRLRELLNLFLDVDIAIKSGTTEKELIMEMLIFKMCQQ